MHAEADAKTAQPEVAKTNGTYDHKETVINGILDLEEELQSPRYSPQTRPLETAYMGAYILLT